MSDLAVTIAPFEQMTAAVWNGVPLKHRTPMQRFSYVKTAAEVLSPDMPVQVVIVGDPAAPRGLAALAFEPVGPKRLGLLGAEALSEPLEVLAADAEAMQAVARALMGLGKALCFGHYPTDAGWIEALQAAAGGRSLVVARARAERGLPCLPLDASWRDPLAHFSSSRRADFRRKLRSAEKTGPVVFDFIRPTREALPALLDEAIEVEGRNWKGREGSAIRCNPLQEKFYRRYAEAAVEEDRLLLCFMRIGDKTAAVQIGDVGDGAFWQHKIGYDEEFQRCSPGNLLMNATIAWCVDNGLERFEFLGKEAEWTTHYTTQARPLAALRTYPYGPVGMGLLAYDLGAFGVRAAKRRLAKTG